MMRRRLLLLPVAWLAGCTTAPALSPSPPAATATTVPPTMTIVSPSPTTLPPSPTTAPPATRISSLTPPAAGSPRPPARRLLVSHGPARHVSLVDPASGVLASIEAGAAPWGIALAPEGRAYVATAEGVAVVDVRQRRRLALIPYRATIGSPQTGEYRPGGMGITVAPDGRRVYVGVYLPTGPSHLEVIDVDRLAVVDAVPVGIRPFDVLSSADGRQVYTIDHDSYSVTVVDTSTLTTRSLAVAPIGKGAFDKPHYAAIDADGRLWLPVQGRVLVGLDVTSGARMTIPLTATTHQHGIARAPDGRLLIVGTGAAGDARGGPSLTIIDPRTGVEMIRPLARPHEQIAVSADGRFAYLTGGYLLAGGWDGMTIVDLVQGTVTERAVPDRPLAVVLLPDDM